MKKLLKPFAAVSLLLTSAVSWAVTAATPTTPAELANTIDFSPVKEGIYAIAAASAIIYIAIKGINFVLHMMRR